MDVMRLGFLQLVELSISTDRQLLFSISIEIENGPQGTYAALLLGRTVFDLRLRGMPGGAYSFNRGFFFTSDDSWHWQWR